MRTARPSRKPGSEEDAWGGRQGQQGRETATKAKDEGRGGLTERTKQQVVIENRPGAGGLMSAKAVLEAPPDGYTLGVIGNGQAIAMSLFKARPYNVLTDFTFVSITARFEMLLAVKANSPLKSLQDVVTAARKDPGKLNFGAINPGSTQNLSAHLLKQVGGVGCHHHPLQDDAGPHHGNSAQRRGRRI